MAFRKSGVRVRRTPIVIVLIATSRRSFVCEGHACSHAPAKTSHPMIAAGFCFAGHGTMHPFSIRTARGCCSAPSRLWESAAAGLPPLFRNSTLLDTKSRPKAGRTTRHIVSPYAMGQRHGKFARILLSTATAAQTARISRAAMRNTPAATVAADSGVSSGRGRVMVPPSASRWRVCGLLLRERGAAGNSIRHAKSLRGDHRLGALA
jgi:hypothetical protein